LRCMIAETTIQCMHGNLFGELVFQCRMHCLA
jgi:hypothetical protein